MTDRELLELAAKAAGLEFGHEVGQYAWQPLYQCLARRNANGTDSLWNPLYNNGDALKLAVKLQFQITPGTYNKDEFTVYKSATAEVHEYYAARVQNEYEATRRAIVRAAAKLGASQS